MLEIASQILICLLIAALIGFIIGYLLCKSTCSDKLDCHNDTHESHNEHEEETQTEENAPLLLGEAPTNPDNLTKIKGIGATIEQKLNEIGIYTFEQIAHWNEENIRWVDTNLAFSGRVKREDWINQAKLLASGEETEFSKRVESGKVASSKPSETN